LLERESLGIYLMLLPLCHYFKVLTEYGDTSGKTSVQLWYVVDIWRCSLLTFIRIIMMMFTVTSTTWSVVDLKN
jgi:hypothetical protein